MKRVDLVGQEYGAFEIVAYLGYPFYLLRCKKCGHEIKRHSSQIHSKQVRRTCPACNGGLTDMECNGGLTDMERQVAKLVMKGLHNKQIAEYLSISDRTVGTHLQNIFNKLNLHSRVQLALYMRDQQHA